MSKWIDADALIKKFGELTVMLWLDFVEEAEIVSLIGNAPSIDIVRCRECKHREEYPCKVYHDDDWYCADGEREGE